MGFCGNTNSRDDLFCGGLAGGAPCALGGALGSTLAAGSWHKGGETPGWPTPTLRGDAF